MGMPTGPVSVDYSTANGTATAGSDYTAVNGTLAFQPWDMMKTISVPVLGDTKFEGSENFFVNLSNASPGATIADGQGVGTIVDDDMPPQVGFDPAMLQVNEAAGTVTVTAKLTGSTTDLPVTVGYATPNGSATSSADFTATNGTLNFLNGDREETFTVPIVNDATYEGTIGESFFATLSNPTNASLGANSQASITINDDDSQPTISINDVQVSESAGTAQFTVGLSNPSTESISVYYQTADATATAGSDYTAIGLTQITFAAGETQKTIGVGIANDALDEIDEAFNVNLSSPSNATIVDGQGVGTILDDDDPPTISFDATLVTVAESDKKAALTVVLTGNETALTVTADFSTVDDKARAGSDYTQTAATVAFAPGQRTQTVEVPILDDGAYELSETFLGVLSNIVAAQPGNTEAIVTINDDDLMPSLAIDDVTVDESAGQANFTVSLSAASGAPLTVDYQTEDDTAVAGKDYDATSGTLTFQPGETKQSLAVGIAFDDEPEDPEQYFVNLSNAQGATMSDGKGVGTITEYTGPSLLSIDDVTVYEEDGSATFTVTREGAINSFVSVAYATLDGSARFEDGDYGSVAGSVSFNPGEKTKQVVVPIYDDSIDEGDEEFYVQLSSPQYAQLRKEKGTGTIRELADKDKNSVTLRAAIEEANAMPGLQKIYFNIGGVSPVAEKGVFVVNSTGDESDERIGDGVASTGKPAEAKILDGVYTIILGKELPAIKANEAVIIDALTQPGEGEGLRIQLTTDGKATTGLAVEGSGSTIRGLTINGFTTGISLPSDGNHVEQNYIGTDPTGMAPRKNTTGIEVTGASNTIGGAQGRNLISGNTSYGVHITGEKATYNVVAGNLIGTDAEAKVTFQEGITTSVMGNNRGIQIDGNSTLSVIGTDGDGIYDLEEGNIVSGNHNQGATITGEGTTKHIFAGNEIARNGSWGVDISQDANVNIAGTNGNGFGGVFGDANERNWIYGNQGANVRIVDSHDNRIAGNLIGFDPTGKAQTNSARGVWISDGSQRNFVGTDSDKSLGDANEGNVISGNSTGVDIDGSGTDDNVVAGNRIGTTTDGMKALANTSRGVIVSKAKRTRIGTNADGTADAYEGNVISGNTTAQVEITGEGADDNRVSGNIIGLSGDSKTKLGEGVVKGVVISGGAKSNYIGLKTTEEATTGGNVIAGLWTGVQLTGPGTEGNHVAGNSIGLSASRVAFGNSAYSVVIEDGASGNVIGFSEPPTEPPSNLANVIAYNDGTGVLVQGSSSVRNSIRGNSIYANTSLGIDLSVPSDVLNFSITANDPGDGDTGPNYLQNFPVITNVEYHGKTTTVTGTIDGVAGKSYSIDLYGNFDVDLSGHGEGQRYLGTVMSDPDKGTFAATVAGDAGIISATATDPDGNTSEFSGNRGLSVFFVKESDYTTGTLSLDNPDKLGGGYRFFPDASQLSENTINDAKTARNRVLVRAVVAGTTDEVSVYFRSTDVDDPSSDPGLDPDPAPGDNFGKLTGAELTWPGAPGTGYPGRLAPKGVDFSNYTDGQVVMVKSSGGAYNTAEVRLATSFAPGDNFRVLAGLSEEAVAKAAVPPTTGPLQEDTAVAVTDQLSVWRRLHIEQDRMLPLSELQGDMATGKITGALPPSEPGTFTVRTNINITEKEGFVGGILRATDDNLTFYNYHIVSHGPGMAAAITVLATPQDSGTIRAPSGNIQIYEDDYGTKPDPRGMMVNIYEIASAKLRDDQVTADIETNTFVPEGAFVNGTLRDEGVNYSILSHTTGSKAKLVISVPEGKPLPAGSVKLYGDLGSNAPFFLADVTDDSGFYDFLQESPNRDINRFADAYIQPDLHSLENFSKTEVTPTPHTRSDNTSDEPQLDDYTEPFRQSQAFETDIFWVSYMTSAFEGSRRQDGDGVEAAVAAGLAQGQATAVFVETARDGLTGAGDQFARVLRQQQSISAAHEHGHAFGLDHTNDVPNLMHKDGAPLDKSYFDPRDIKKLRLRVASPSGPKEIQHLDRAPDGHLDARSDEPIATLSAAAVDLRPEIANSARSSHADKDLLRTAAHQFVGNADGALPTPKPRARLLGAWGWLRSTWRGFALNSDAVESASISRARAEDAEHRTHDVSQHTQAISPRSYAPYQRRARRSAVAGPVIMRDNLNANDVVLADDPMTGEWDGRGLRIFKRGKE